MIPRRRGILVREMARPKQKHQGENAQERRSASSLVRTYRARGLCSPEARRIASLFLDGHETTGAIAIREGVDRRSLVRWVAMLRDERRDGTRVPSTPNAEGPDVPIRHAGPETPVVSTSPGAVHGLAHAWLTRAS